MQDRTQTTLPTVALLVVVVYLVSLWFRAATYKLKHIPTVGSSGVVSSYFDSLRFFLHGHEMIQEGYTKYYGTAFKVSTMSRWMVIVSGSQMIDDVRRATEDQLSFGDAIAEVIQTDYTIGRPIRVDLYHVAVVRTPLTRNLGVRFSDIKDEITTAFADLVPVTEKEWISVPALKTIMKIVCRTSNRLFIGLPLCRNSDYRSLNEQFTVDVIKGAQIINMFPNILKPIVGRLLTTVPTKIKLAVALAGPIIQDRLDKEAQYGSDWPEKPNDLISWLLEEAQEHNRNVHDLTSRLLSINFAAIHTTSSAFTQILYDLAVHPGYVVPMREEVESVISGEGWTKGSMGKMRKVDSFIKESQRLVASALSMNRKAVKDFTFSNGVTVPAGTHIAVATLSTHVDEHNYRNPDEFDGFRFADMRQEEGESTKHQMVSLSSDYITFGHGRHACPGRFFAVNELKAMLAHVLLTYDVRLPNHSPRPENFWFQGTCSPNQTAEVMFRKRAA